uniref:SWIM zinc finger family protein n=1 Tax=Sulfolobus sp. NOB8H2 TaxID=84600 RepID=UPI00159ED740|nr:SWIM zinc finger family protein [Sulfolobus sp. NOB8H2]
MISTQIPKNPIKRLDVFYNLSEGVIVSADIQSKSRANLVHYTRLVLDPLTLKVAKASCDCEASAFGKKCWHVKTLEELVKTDLKNEIEKARQEMLQTEEDIANWG